MATRDDDTFRVRPSPPRSRRASDGRFVSRALKAATLAGGPRKAGRFARPDSTFGRGHAAAGLAGRGLGRHTRRVVIKARYVVLKRASAQSVATHLRYIARDGVTRDGERGQAYGAETDRADLKAFEERGKSDRHQFRFIVSVEDAPQLEDLRVYTRALMQRMSADLETPLDWVAVDHWDTDNPHTHIVLRGRTGEGRDLVIAPDYMAHGMRTRAQEIATQWLGPRTELEIQESLRKEISQDRFTSLDRQLLRHAQGNQFHLTVMENSSRGYDHTSPLLGGRLQHLEALGLAQKLAPHYWALDPGFREKLTELSARGDIIQTMHRVLKGESRELALAQSPQAPIVGRVLAKGLADEMRDVAYLVVDGLDGRAHYAKLPAGTELSRFPIESIVQLAARESTANAENTGPQRRRAVMLLSEMPMERQVNFVGPTWLDRHLVGKKISIGAHGFGAAAQSALQQRIGHLIGEGLASGRHGEIRFAPNLLNSLRDRELAFEGERLAKAMGKSFTMHSPGEIPRGLLVSKHQLASGKFGLIDNGLALSFIPWRTDFDTQLGQHLKFSPRSIAEFRRGISR
jgi:type IV secretory pathway VirD2 relaxase